MILELRSGLCRNRSFYCQSVFLLFLLSSSGVFIVLFNIAVIFFVNTEITRCRASAGVVLIFFVYGWSEFEAVGNVLYGGQNIVLFVVIFNMLFNPVVFESDSVPCISLLADDRVEVVAKGFVVFFLFDFTLHFVAMMINDEFFVRSVFVKIVVRWLLVVSNFC